jgi:chemotaxis protein MotB
MARRFLCAVLIPLMLGGCTYLEGASSSEGASGESIRAENERLRARIETLSDSLQLYDDASTGRIYRELRVLNDQIDRMAYELSLLREGGTTVAVISANELFESASATLASGSAERLAELADRLNELYPGRQIHIEGHSDDIPITGDLKEQYPSNWELSAARAATVARHLISEHDFAADRFTVIGYGSTQPIASNETARGRRMNRRVRIAVLPKPRDYSRPYDTSW